VAIVPLHLPQRSSIRASRQRRSLEDMSEPTYEQVFTALKDSGFLLEQQVATILERRAFGVRVSASYVDPDEEKPREIDVVAFRNASQTNRLGDALAAVLVIECKRSMSPNITFTRPWTEHERAGHPYQVVLGSPGPFPDESAAMHSTVWDGFSLGAPWSQLRLDRVQRGSQLLRIDRDKGAFAARSVINDMGMPTIKATHCYREDWRDKNTIFFPACVTGGRLLATSPTIADASELTEIAFASIAVESRAPWLARVSHSRAYFDIVPFANLNEYIDHVLSVTEGLATHLAGS